MTFFLGFVLGVFVVLGAGFVYLAKTQMDDDKTDGTCPPCNGQCAQGRKCPANKGEIK